MNVIFFINDLSILFSYPSSFIDEQFRKFSFEYLSSWSFLPFIDNEKQYSLLYHKLNSQPTTRQPHVAVNLTAAITGNIHIDQLNSTEETKSIESNKKTTNPMKKPYTNKIIIHYTHEKRFHSFKRDMHKIYDDNFKNSPAMDAKILVGNRNRPDAKHELIRKRPKQAILQNKPIKSKYLKIKE
jgi:hypothetical protein